MALMGEPGSSVSYGMHVSICCGETKSNRLLRTKISKRRALEDLQALRDCIQALPPEYREVVILRELEELSYKEISTAAGVALGTVMSRLNRARIRLENCLTGKGKEIRQ
jgi:RNA polymerase sigma factor (sigma-70 family)